MNLPGVLNPASDIVVAGLSFEMLPDLQAALQDSNITTALLPIALPKKEACLHGANNSSEVAF